MTDPIGPIRSALAGRYEIEREIGKGAFARVYLARDLRHDRLVAFKVLNADPTSQNSELRFLSEIRLLAKLQHPNIVPLIDSGHAGATPASLSRSTSVARRWFLMRVPDLCGVCGIADSSRGEWCYRDLEGPRFIPGPG